jgi:hypothetical protein
MHFITITTVLVESASVNPLTSALRDAPSSKLLLLLRAFVSFI